MANAAPESRQRGEDGGKTIMIRLPRFVPARSYRVDAYIFRLLNKDLKGGRALPLEAQLLWLKELETYKRFPPLQSPESWKLDHVTEQIRNGMGHPSQ
jgi:hypothetical protein